MCKHVPLNRKVKDYHGLMKVRNSWSYCCND